MKDNAEEKYSRRLFWNIIKSGITAVFAVILLLMFYDTILKNMASRGFDTSFFETPGMGRSGMAMIFVIVAIVIFSVVFWKLQENYLHYLEQITIAMKQVSEGDLSVRLPVTGDDELTQMADELNMMAEDIQNLMERERASERSKNELVTNVAHDLRTPLTSIRGYLDLLDKNPNLDEETRAKYTSIALDKTLRLQDLIEELFGFTKMSYGKVSVKPARLDLVKLLEQLVDEFYPSFEKNHLEFEFHSNVSEIYMMGDGMLLARLFSNLINNAIKYGADGKRIIIDVVYEDPLVIVSVINFGRVIPEDKIDKIFDKFYRVDDSRNAAVAGTGLGLAIAQNITRLHAGQISVRSDLDGTVFEVRLRSDHDFSKEEFVGVDDL